MAGRSKASSSETSESEPGRQPDADGVSFEHPLWQVPTIDTQRRLLSGVSGAVATELGVDIFLVRLAWIVLFATGGWGALIYVALWGLLSWTDYTNRSSQNPFLAKGRTTSRRLVGFALVVIGLAGIFSGLVGLDQAILWPAALMTVGLLLSWRRFDPRVANRSLGAHPMAQAIGGLVIATVGAALLVFSSVGVNTAAAVLYFIIFVLAVVVLATSPWWWRFLQNLDRERQAKAASDERAVVAAHLHDSVLQTLSLIQRNSDDPRVMLNLARRQERELRNWLDPDRASRLGGSVRGHLDAMASEIEELYGTPVEVVVVGDVLVEDAIGQTLAAAREAVVNAAKHSGADQVDVYVEISETRVEMFVRDRGIGFDPKSIQSDRRGIRDSINARMARVGGTALISSSAGGGTEVELSLPLTNATTPRAEPTAGPLPPKGESSA